MAKIKKTPPVGEKAPKVEKEKIDPVVELMNGTDKERIAKNVTGLDPNHRMDLIKTMHETFRKDPMAPEHTGFSPEAVGEINKLNAMMQIAALVCEVTLAKNEFTMLLPVREVEKLKLISAEMDISIKTNLLPAPDENGNVAVPTAAIVVGKETKESIKEENKLIESEPVIDPTQIKNKEELHKSLAFILADSKTCPRPYDRIVRLIDFYRSYLYIAAGEDKEKKEEIKSMASDQLFSDAIKEIGTLTFSSFILARGLYTETSKTKSPIPAFCMFRTASLNKTTGYPTVEDNLVASFVRILVATYANILTQRDKESIETCKESIKILSKNKKQNEKAIEKEQNKIKDYEGMIESYREVVGYVTDPSSENIDDFENAYDNKEHEDYKLIRRISHNIFDAYYPGIDIKTVEKDVLMHNLQQYAGVIINMFRDPLAQLQEYSESNIQELVFVKEEKETKPEKEPTKK